MQTKEIHIKATCENENRRFCISEAKFETLKQFISNLFSIEHGTDFIVKYKDDENDLVTISSDEELIFAANLFPTDILRLTITLPKQSAIDGCKMKTSHPDCASKKWHHGGKHMMMDDERRNHWLLAKRERIQAKLLKLEGADLGANPKLRWKQDHLKQKLQSLDEKMANKESGYPRGPMKDKHCKANFLTMKKERIEACLKELEGTDFTAYPGLMWKQEHLKRKLQAIEAKLANKEPVGHCHKFGGRHGHGYGRGGKGRHCEMRERGSMGRHAHSSYDGPLDERQLHFLSAKKERIQRRLKEMESMDFETYPGALWKQEHLKKKLQNIEMRLANTNVTSGVKSAGDAPSPVIPEPAPAVSNEDIKKTRAGLKLEKQTAAANCRVKKEAYLNAKRQQQEKGGDQNEEIAKFHEEFLNAKEAVLIKKKALCEFNARTRADREQAKC